MDGLAWHVGESHQRTRAALELCSGVPWSCREEKSSACSDLQVVQLVICFVHKEKWLGVEMHVNSGGNGIWFGWSVRDLEGEAFEDWEKRGLGKGMWMGPWEGAQGVKIFYHSLM